jgi:hypothetical protein
LRKKINLGSVFSANQAKQIGLWLLKINGHPKTVSPAQGQIGL